MYLGIDVGTQSVKVVCYDDVRHAVVVSSSSPLDMISDADGTREQLADWWLVALRACMAQIDKNIRDRVVAIGVSGQQHGFVPMAADDSVLAPVKLWCDTTTVEECREITTNFGERDADCIREAGNAILPGYTAPKIRWLKNHKPDQYARLDKILLPHDFINFYLTGEKVMEAGDASGTGLLDIRSRQWHPAMLRAVDADRDLSACLPSLVSADHQVGTLRSQAAQELGLPTGVLVAPGGGDNMMAAIGTGNVAMGRMTVSLGTSGTLFAYEDHPVIDPSGSIAGFCDSTGGWLPLLCTMNCTVSTELTRDLFQLSVDELDGYIDNVPPGSHGVMTLPFFNGERSPNLPNAKGCLFGLDADNYKSANLLRSAMESSVYSLRTGLDAFRALGCEVDRIRLTGGGSNSASWRQMVADIFNLPVTVQKIDEGAALGAALQAYWIKSGAGDLSALVDSELTEDAARGCQPNADAAGAYADHYTRFLEHVGSVATLYK